MRELLIAEWQKMTGNRWLAGFLIWIYPVGAVATVLVMSLIALVSDSFADFIRQDPGLWTEQVVGALGLPTNAFGRILLIGFAVVVFAGEYQWGTWKNTVPRSTRTKLIFSKFITLLVLVSVACILFALIWGLGRGLMVKIAGAEYGPALTGAVLRDFLGDFAGRYLLVMVTVFISASLAALVVMVTRSIMAGLMFGVGLAIAEPIAFIGLTLTASVLKAPWILHLGRALPYYHFDNAVSWIVNEAPSSLTSFALTLGPEYAFQDSLTVSLVVLVSWAIILPALIIYLFQRQDITS
ncbi:MAG: ABC transporter permease [Anaerolineales bacterium]|nr:ABC transporter permease [Anaerolineales bacterium]